MSRGDRLRLAAEELGPTFIKMGQVFSSRPDLIPPDIAAELEKLQDKVAPLPFDTIKKVIEKQLGGPVEDYFSDIEEESLAAASIAQVHKATLKSGEDVVLKVSRPGIRSTIEIDLEILSDLAGVLTKYTDDLPFQDPLGVVEEFDKSIHRELDFLQEGRNIERFARMFQTDATVYIPKYYSELSTSQLLVLEYIDGIKVSKLDKIREAGLDPVLISERGARLVLTQIFEYGFFHADPHPGNIMVLPDNVIAPLDYGMVGYLSDATIEELGNIMVGVVKKDIRRVLRSYDSLGITRQTSDLRSLQETMEEYINRYYEIPIGELKVEELVVELFGIVHKHHLKMPANLTLMIKALVTLAGLGIRLNPEFDMISQARPYAKRLMLKRFDPRHRLQQGLTMIDGLYRLGEDFPEAARDIITKARRGEITLQFEHRNLEDLVGEIHRSSNLLAQALIIASLIVGSSMLVQVSFGPHLMGLPVFALIGYSMVVLLGIRLIWEILRGKVL